MSSVLEDNNNTTQLFIGKFSIAGLSGLWMLIIKKTPHLNKMSKVSFMGRLSQRDNNSIQALWRCLVCLFHVNTSWLSQESQSNKVSRQWSELSNTRINADSNPNSDRWIQCARYNLQPQPRKICIDIKEADWGQSQNGENRWKIRKWTCGIVDTKLVWAFVND